MSSSLIMDPSSTGQRVIYSRSNSHSEAEIIPPINIYHEEEEEEQGEVELGDATSISSKTESQKNDIGPDDAQQQQPARCTLSAIVPTILSNKMVSSSELRFTTAAVAAAAAAAATSPGLQRQANTVVASQHDTTSSSSSGVIVGPPKSDFATIILNSTTTRTAMPTLRGIRKNSGTKFSTVSSTTTDTDTDADASGSTTTSRQRRPTLRGIGKNRGPGTSGISLPSSHAPAGITVAGGGGGSGVAAAAAAASAAAVTSSSGISTGQIVVAGTRRSNAGQSKLAKLDRILGRNSHKSRQQRQQDQQGSGGGGSSGGDGGNQLLEAGEEEYTVGTVGMADEQSISLPPTTLLSDASPFQSYPQGRQEEGSRFYFLSAAGQAAAANTLQATTLSTLQRVSNTDGLVMATAIDDPSAEAAALVMAYEVDSEELERKAMERKKNKECIVVGLLLILISLAVLFGTNFGAATRTRTKTATTKNGTDRVPTLRVPSLAPSHIPSSVPTAVLDSLLEILPVQSQDNICCNTPQYKAWEWLTKHPNITNFQSWRKKQLFALATFFFAFEGANSWPKPIRDRWMDYEKEECLWFSNGFGWLFNDGEYFEYLEDQVPSCSDDGEFISLHLEFLPLSGSNPSIPPEIALLTSLSAIRLLENGIDSSLSNMLPSELILLTNLTVMDFSSNSLSGQLSSDLSLLTKLSTIYLEYNDLTGPLLSELGLMTSLEELSLFGNALTGSLPSELGLMNSITHLDIDDNALGGQLPTEVGAMKSLEWLFLSGNALTGPLPTQLGLVYSLHGLFLNGNTLTGPLPGELGCMTGLEWLELHGNALSGPLPTELGAMAHLEHLRLENNTLTGSIPADLESLIVNGSLKSLTLANNYLSGTVPKSLCSLGVFDATWDDYGAGLSFDCTDQLCGCCWCPCPESNYSGYCMKHP